MFEFVHHIRILARSRDEMVQYLEETFGMKPVKLEVYPKRGMKNAIYKVGQTNLEITEPLDPNSRMGKFLEANGPGVYHMAWGVTGIEKAAAALDGKGQLRKEGGLGQSAEGYLTANIDRARSMGLEIQLAEGELNLP